MFVNVYVCSKRTQKCTLVRACVLRLRKVSQVFECMNGAVQRYAWYYVSCAGRLVWNACRLMSSLMPRLGRASGGAQLVCARRIGLYVRVRCMRVCFSSLPIPPRLSRSRLPGAELQSHRIVVDVLVDRVYVCVCRVRGCVHNFMRQILRAVTTLACACTTCRRACVFAGA